MKHNQSSSFETEKKYTVVVCRYCVNQDGTCKYQGSEAHFHVLNLLKCTDANCHYIHPVDILQLQGAGAALNLPLIKCKDKEDLQPARELVYKITATEIKKWILTGVNPKLHFFLDNTYVEVSSGKLILNPNSKGKYTSLDKNIKEIVAQIQKALKTKPAVRVSFEIDKSIIIFEASSKTIDEAFPVQKQVR